MSRSKPDGVNDGRRIPPEQVCDALTRDQFIYTDGATQSFAADGRTTYVEHGTPSDGEWGVDADGRFWSFWPPSYRAEYDVSWLVDPAGRTIGVRFVDVQRGGTFEGRYKSDAGRR